MLSRKEFERQYSAELLPSSMANYGIGDLWDWKGFIVNRRLTPLNDNVADVCGDNNLLQLLTTIPADDASLPDIDITSDFKSDASLTIPSMSMSLKDVLDVNKVVSFSFSNVKGKNSKGYRTKMSDALNDLKSKNFDRYKQRIREYEVVIGLFYAGAVNLSVSRTVTNAADIEAKLKSIPGATVNLDTNDVTAFKFVISNSVCPFAAEFIDGREL